MLNNRKMNKVEDFELNNVVGGTVKETGELWDAIDTYTGFAGDVFSALRNNMEILGFAGCVGKSAAMLAMAPLMEKTLKEAFGIDAYISVGWGGTGFRSTNNRYSLNGKSLSQQEVVEMIKAAA